MIRIKELEVRFPKWKWWQVVLGIIAITVAANVAPMETLQTAKELLKAWLINR